VTEYCQSIGVVCLVAALSVAVRARNNMVRSCAGRGVALCCLVLLIINASAEQEAAGGDGVRVGSECGLLRDCCVDDRNILLCYG
jgi:hypothetical protein